jgi:hypothetical protein
MVSRFFSADNDLFSYFFVLEVVNLWGYTLDYSDSYSTFSLLSGFMNLINAVATTLDLVYIGKEFDFYLLLSLSHH